MTLFARRLLMYAACVEILLFLLLYYFGSNGTHVITQLALERELILQEIASIQLEVDSLGQKISQGRTSFAKEKIARERLHMKKKDETVYFLKR